jgi:hypothetical protein
MLRVIKKESDQIALPPNARFREDAFDLRAHGVISHADRRSVIRPLWVILGFGNDLDSGAIMRALCLSL